MHGLRHSQPEELPDVFVNGIPMTFETAPAYFRVKNFQAWPGARIELHAWDTWEKLGDRLGDRLGRHIWHPSHWDNEPIAPPHVLPEENPVPISERTALLTLCSQLHDAGIWLSLNDADALIMGPSALVKAHPDLLAAVRAHKADITHLLEDCLAHGLYGTQTDDPRFAREVCPDCGQACLIVSPPRRLGVHRLPGGTQVCPGSERAQREASDVILGAFLADRCLERRMAVLTWYALRGALECWCLERGFLLPPRPFLIAWLDAHYTRQGEDDRPMWQGLTLTLPEWGLEDDAPAPLEASQVQILAKAVPQKLVLKA